MGKASKDRRDIFYRLAKEQGWRARSAFKLLQADETFNLLEGVTRAVDLCAAPGGWSQVLSKRMYEPKSAEEREKVKIIAVDMQGMAPIDGVTQLRADITKESTAKAIIDFFDGQKAQLVVSDGAPDVTGMHDWDAYMQAQLLLTALSIATYILEEGGSFMGKVYRAANTSSVYRQLKRFFKDCCVFKPSASRNSSIEAFVVCRQFCMPINHVPCNLITEWYTMPGAALKDITGKKPDPVEHLPFVAHQCEYDADLSYPLDEDYVQHEAVQKPLTAAYQEIKEKTRTMNIRYNGYKVCHENDPPPPQETEIKYDAEGNEIPPIPVEIKPKLSEILAFEAIAAQELREKEAAEKGAAEKGAADVPTTSKLFGYSVTFLETVERQAADGTIFHEFREKVVANPTASEETTAATSSQETGQKATTDSTASQDSGEKEAAGPTTSKGSEYLTTPQATVKKEATIPTSCHETGRKEDADSTASLETEQKEAADPTTSKESREKDVDATSSQESRKKEATDATPSQETAEKDATNSADA